MCSGSTGALLSATRTGLGKDTSLDAFTLLVEEDLLLKGESGAVLEFGLTLSGHSIRLPLLIFLALVHALSVDDCGARESTLTELTLALIDKRSAASGRTLSLG